MHIVYVSDGKAGHRSQAIGLFKAMQRQSQQAVTFEEISIVELAIFPLIMGIMQHKIPQLKQTPDYIFGVGSHTQFRVLLLGEIYKQAKTVILMKPNFPCSWFDYAVIPEHDAVAEQGNVIVSRGALNPIVDEQQHISGRILLALGGSSKRHTWNDQKVLTAIENIVQQNPHGDIILTTSRRTPSDFLSQLKQKKYAEKLQIFPVEQTPQGWIFEQMQLAEAVWVTEDSVSMIFEALTAGCKVGVIKIDQLKSDRITKMLDQLVSKSVIDQINEPLLTLKLNEATRVAQVLLKT